MDAVLVGTCHVNNVKLIAMMFYCNSEFGEFLNCRDRSLDYVRLDRSHRVLAKHCRIQRLLHFVSLNQFSCMDTSGPSLKSSIIGKEIWYFPVLKTRSPMSGTLWMEKDWVLSEAIMALCGTLMSTGSQQKCWQQVQTTPVNCGIVKQVKPWLHWTRRQLSGHAASPSVAVTSCTQLTKQWDDHAKSTSLT